MSQNVILSGLMKRNIQQEETAKRCDWKYYYCHPVNDIQICVCSRFLCNLIQITQDRLRTVQNKKKQNETLGDKRGKHENHAVKLSEQLKQLIREHCESFPHTESHYASEKTNLKYFENPELNISRLYESFLNFYESRTGNSEVPLSYVTFGDYFNHEVNFTFRLPRTDICNICYENELKVEKNEDFIIHKKRVTEYQILKKNMLKEKDVLCCEFDFGQNLPLPKINVSDQFYRRLIWLHIFNVHFYNQDNSYMFMFMEGYFKKGANTVCNFVSHSILNEFKSQSYNQIFIFSDACGGQNRNYCMVGFLSLLSEHLQLEIHHLYPVRGHSYCQCDRNFGLYGKKKNKMQKIETEQEYIDLVRNSRSKPFIIVERGECRMIDMDTLMKQNVKIPKKFQISKAVKIIYSPDQKIQVFTEYNGSPTEYEIKRTISYSDFENAPPPELVGITREKIKDLQSLQKFLSPEGQEFFQNYLSSVRQKTVASSHNDENTKENDAPKKRGRKRKTETALCNNQMIV